MTTIHGGSRVSRLVSGVALLTLVVAGCGSGSSKPPQAGSSSDYSTPESPLDRAIVFAASSPDYSAPETLDHAIVIAHDVVLTTRRKVAGEYTTKYRNMNKHSYVGCGGGGFDYTNSRTSASIDLAVPEGERIPLGKEVAEYWRARGFNLVGADDWESRDDPGFAADIVPNVRASFTINYSGQIDITAYTECLPNPDDDPQSTLSSEKGSPPIAGR